MKRRDLVKNVVALGATAGLVGCSGKVKDGAPAVHTNPRIKWRLASSFPRSLDTLYGGAVTLADRLREMTDGAFNIRVHQAGELVPGLQVMDAVSQGTVHVGHTASYYYKGKDPALAFDTCVPFGMTARQQNAWLQEGGGRELVNELFADFNIVSYGAGNTGVQMGGWFKQPVTSLSELKGLRMRIPGLGGEVMNALGVSVQVIAGGEIYTALERGAIDATEWVGPYDDEKLGLHQVARHYYYPGWWEPGPSLSFYVNKDALSSLPSTYQAAFAAAAAEAAAVMQARYDAKNPAAFRRLLAAGIDVQPFSDDIMTGAREASEQLLRDHAAADARYDKLYKHWDAARKDAFAWFSTAEAAYARVTSG